MSFCRIQLENYNILIFFKINTSSSRYFYLLLFICNRKKLNRVFLTYRLTSWKVMPSCWNTEKINEKQSMIFLLSLPLPFFTKTLSSKFWFCHCTKVNTHFWFNHKIYVIYTNTQGNIFRILPIGALWAKNGFYHDVNYTELV